MAYTQSNGNGRQVIPPAAGVSIHVVKKKNKTAIGLKQITTFQIILKTVLTVSGTTNRVL